MTTIPIICINLLRATERKRNILDHWTQKLNIPIEFIEAFDRRDIDSDKIEKKISDGEAACNISHVLAYEYMQKNNYSHAIIIEDDVIPLFNNSSELYSSINNINDEFSNLEVILLHNIRLWKRHPPKTIIQKKYYSSLVSGNPYGTCGYYIKNTAIDVMRTKLLSFCMPADHHWFLFGEQQKLAILNNPLMHHDIINTTTYIDRPRDTRRKFIE